MSITASLGQLGSRLNAVYAPAPSRPDTPTSFARSLSRLGTGADRPAGVSPAAPDASPRSSLSSDRGGAPDADRVLAILRKYPPTNEGIRRAMPELQRAYPGVELLDHPERLDKLRFPDGTVVDTIIGAGAPGSRWGWIVEEHGTGHPGGPSPSDLGGVGLPQPGNVRYEYDWVPPSVIDTLGPVDGHTPGSFRHQLAGFSLEKLDPTHAHSMNLKYVAARIFEQIDVYGGDALDRAVAVLREQGFDVTKVGDDKIDFGDGQGPIDVIRNMSDTPTDLAWQWLV